MIGTVQHCDWFELARRVGEAGGCDAVICDPPYSARTSTRSDRTGTKGTRALGYDAISSQDCAAFAADWHAVTRGWIVVFCDHGLASSWESAMEATGRYVFAPLAYVVRGSRIRLAGDGPSQWSTWIIVARPRCDPYSRWGTLPGAYVEPYGFDDRAGRGGNAGPVRGSKSTWIMERMVEDYSRQGDIIVDPCCGSGTTLVAAETTRRRWIGGDCAIEQVEHSRARLSRQVQVSLTF